MRVPLLKFPVQVPLTIFEPAEEPKPQAGGRLHAVVIAAERTASPPAGFDPLWPPLAGDAMHASIPFEGNRRTIRHDRDGMKRERRMMEKERTDSRSVRTVGMLRVPAPCF